MHFLLYHKGIYVHRCLISYHLFLWIFLKILRSTQNDYAFLSNFLTIRKEWQCFYMNKKHLSNLFFRIVKSINSFMLKYYRSWTHRATRGLLLQAEKTAISATLPGNREITWYCYYLQVSQTAPERHKALQRCERGDCEQKGKEEALCKNSWRKKQHLTALGRLCWLPAALS